MWLLSGILAGMLMESLGAKAHDRVRGRPSKRIWQLAHCQPRTAWAKFNGITNGRRPAVAVTDKVLEFLEFMEAQGKQSVAALLDSLLRKSRDMTGAEAGTIFISHNNGGKNRLRPVALQNDQVKVRKVNFDIPVGQGTIAGHVAATGETLLISDV
jgi:hypothetical protein